MYFPLPGGTQARYAELTVYSDTGADVCVGRVPRRTARDPAAAGMDLGADLSFTPQELAAGAQFSYDGKPGTPVTIMRDGGRELRADATVGGPAARLQRPGVAIWRWRGRCARPG